MPALPVMDPPAICIQDASQRYGLPVGAIHGILAAEHGGPNVVHHNKDRTDDLGWMQVNTKWLQYFSPYGITREVLLKEDCINIAVGSWILKHYYLMFHDWTRAIRAYNVGPVNVSQSDTKGFTYATKVIVRWRQVALTNSARLIVPSLPAQAGGHATSTHSSPIEVEEFPHERSLSSGSSTLYPVLIPD